MPVDLYTSHREKEKSVPHPVAHREEFPVLDMNVWISCCEQGTPRLSFSSQLSHWPVPKVLWPRSLLPEEVFGFQSGLKAAGAAGACCLVSAPEAVPSQCWFTQGLGRLWWVLSSHWVAQLLLVHPYTAAALTARVDRQCSPGCAWLVCCP